MSVQVLVPWRDSGCEHRRAAWNWCRQRWEQLHPDWPIILGTTDREPFSVAAALNHALDQATADVVIAVGADTVVDARAAENACLTARTAPWVLVDDMHLRLDHAQTSDLIDQPPADPVNPTRYNNDRHRSTNGWGPIAARADQLRKVRWDERFQGWGGEDDAFALAATTILGPPARGTTTTILLWHPSRQGFDQFTYDRNEARLDMYHRAAGNRVAMGQLCAPA